MAACCCCCCCCCSVEECAAEFGALSVAEEAPSSSDEQFLEVKAAVAEKCETLKHVIEDECDGVIPVPSVEWETLKKVLQWCEHEAAIGDKPADWGEEETNKWEHEYVDSFTTDDLYNLIMAANYLNAKKMVEDNGWAFNLATGCSSSSNY